MIDFNNTEVAFSMKSNADLRNAYLLFSTIQSPAIVRTAKGATMIALKLQLPLAWAVKPTLYRQFVGGETLEDCLRNVNILNNYNVKSVLDYSAEGGTELEDVQKAYEETIRSIEFAAGSQAIAYTVFKPTAMIINRVLVKASENFPSLGDIEKAEYDNFRERIFALCEKAYKRNVRILIDAEHFAYQELIDRIVEEAMRRFNKERAIVFQTLQMYRKDRLEYLKFLHNDSLKVNYIPGIKFVRGAYMEDERARAYELSYIDPIHPNKESTDQSYNEGLRYVVENIDNFELFSGTHNYESNQLLAQLIDEKGLKRDDKRIFFSQLYGMSDNISFTLAREGFNVCKYIPYAPVNKVLPYLLRRAEENTSMSGQTGRELQLIKAELDRRRTGK
ncbi:MAG: proline dehydrogenase [Bacteroidetes bacterium GWF2_40_14]|nr:MAG: proline dehydrogenase [Bacteroidetes bacterium GWF2_40_14]